MTMQEKNDRRGIRRSPKAATCALIAIIILEAIVPLFVPDGRYCAKADVLPVYYSLCALVTAVTLSCCAEVPEEDRRAERLWNTMLAASAAAYALAYAISCFACAMIL